MCQAVWPVEGRDEKGEKLVVLIEGGIQFRQGDSGFRADGEVAGIVMGDLVKSSHVQCDVVARGGDADGELGAIAAGNEGELFESGEADDFGDFFGGGGFCDDGGQDFVDGVVGAGCGIDQNVRGSDDGSKAREDAGGRTSHGME